MSVTDKGRSSIAKKPALFILTLIQYTLTTEFRNELEAAASTIATRPEELWIGVHQISPKVGIVHRAEVWTKNHLRSKSRGERFRLGPDSSASHHRNPMFRPNDQRIVSVIRMVLFQCTRCLSVVSNVMISKPFPGQGRFRSP